MNTPYKEEKFEELLKQLAADFLLRESNGRALITVTRAKISHKFTQATVFITVFPENNGSDALDFTKRKRTEFREYVMKHAKMRRLPLLDFAIDIGEKNRQRIDHISNETLQ